MTDRTWKEGIPVNRTVVEDANKVAEMYGIDPLPLG